MEGGAKKLENSSISNANLLRSRLTFWYLPKRILSEKTCSLQKDNLFFQTLNQQLKQLQLWQTFMLWLRSRVRRPPGSSVLQRLSRHFRFNCHWHVKFVLQNANAVYLGQRRFSFFCTGSAILLNMPKCFSIPGQNLFGITLSIVNFAFCPKNNSFVNLLAYGCSSRPELAPPKKDDNIFTKLKWNDNQTKKHKPILKIHQLRQFSNTFVARNRCQH